MTEPVPLSLDEESQRRVREFEALTASAAERAAMNERAKAALAALDKPNEQ